MAILRCHCHSCGSFIISQVKISSTEDKEIDKREMAILGSIEKRSKSPAASCIDISPMIKKVDGCFLVSLLSCHMKSYLSMAWLLLVHLCSPAH